MSVLPTPSAALCLLALSVSSPVHAHPLSPSLLQLDELAAGRFEVTLKTPRVRARGLTPEPRMPPHCTMVAASAPDAMTAEAHSRHWSLDCPGGLRGVPIAIDGLQPGRDTGIVRIVHRDGRVVQQLVSGDAPALAVTQPQGAAAVAAQYIGLGMRHLWLGLDHVLLLLALVLLIRGRRTLLLAITAFTAGHSVTLALAALGLLHIPAALAELAIAASLLAVAVELPSAMSAAGARVDSPWVRRPYLLSGLVGLLHGLGFASALRGVGLPQDALPLALASFNVGIEAAQLLALIPLVLLCHMLRRAALVRPWPRLGLAYAIGVPAAYWSFERGALLSEQMGSWS